MNRGKSRGRGRDFSQIVCKICNKVGHYVEDCRTSIDKIHRFHQNTAQFENYQDFHDGSEYVFTNIESTTLQVSTFLRSENEDAWILDTKETQHMTFR